MSWLDAIKDLVVEEDPKPTTQLQTLLSRTNLPPGNLYNIPASPPPAFQAPDAFLQKLRSKLATPGSAVEKFEAVLTSLSAIADDHLRLTSTLSVLKSTAGVETQALIQEYAGRQQRLASEAQAFASVIAGQQKSDVDDKQTQIAAIDVQLQQLSMQRQSLTSAITDAQSKLTRSQAGFDAAVSTVRGEIEGALSKLKGL
jgi:chromosome segregation ATPase